MRNSLKLLTAIALMTSSALADTQMLYLNEGWNLKGISINTDIESFNDTEVETIWKWEGNWSVWSPSESIRKVIKSYNLPLLEKINAGEGFWVKAKSEVKLSLEGEENIPDELTISSGWSLHSLGGGAPVNVSEVFSQGVEAVWKWENGSWKLWSPDEKTLSLAKSYGIESFDYLYPAEGFWVKANKNLVVSPYKYDRLVLIVLEGDDLGYSSLTENLQKNYNDLVEGLSAANSKVKFLVIWDGNLKNGVDGETDVFILDPHSGKDLSILLEDMKNIIAGDDVSNYYNDGIRYWFSESDNLSNHLKELIETALTMYPAKKVDLIISDHGDGWVSLPTPTTRTVLFESSSDGESAGTTWLGTKQFVDTVLEPLAEEGIKFDLLGFDECLMGEFATLTLLQPYANVFVVSPEYEEADGWGDVWKKLPQWYASTNDTWTIAKNIVDGYADYYKANEPECSLCYPVDVALTAVKREGLESLVSAFEEFSESLYKTALNEKENGQMYEVFKYYFDNDYLPIADKIIYWGASGGYGEEDNDNVMGQLYYSLDSTSYIGEYGNDGSGSFLGYDLLYLIRSTGIAARALELGHQFGGDYYKIYENGVSQYLSPSFDPLTDDRAVDFVNTYNSTVANDQLYTKYLYIDYDLDTVPEERQGSGLGLIYPYTSPLQADTPKLTLCNYQNFIDSYNSTLPNYAGFVKTVFGEMWKALGSAYKFVEVDVSGKHYFGWYETYECTADWCESSWVSELSGHIYYCDSNIGELSGLYVWKDGTVSTTSDKEEDSIGKFEDVVTELGNLTEDEIYLKVKNSGK